MKDKRFGYSFFSLMMLMSACAFKEPNRPGAPDPAKEGETPKEVPGSTVKKSGMAIVSWLEEDKSQSPEYKRELTSYDVKQPLRISAPVVLSRGVPEEIQLAISSTTLEGKTLGRALASGKTSLDRGMPYELPVVDFQAASEPPAA